MSREGSVDAVCEWVSSQWGRHGTADEWAHAIATEFGGQDVSPDARRCEGEMERYRKALELIAYHEPQEGECAEAMRQLAREVLGLTEPEPTLDDDRAGF